MVAMSSVMTCMSSLTMPKTCASWVAEHKTPMGLRCGNVVIFVEKCGLRIERLRKVTESWIPIGEGRIGPAVVDLSLDKVVRDVILLRLVPRTFWLGICVR